MTRAKGAGHSFLRKWGSTRCVEPRALVGFLRFLLRPERVAEDDTADRGEEFTETKQDAADAELHEADIEGGDTHNAFNILSDRNRYCHAYSPKGEDDRKQQRENLAQVQILEVEKGHGKAPLPELRVLYF